MKIIFLVIILKNNLDYVIGLIYKIKIENCKYLWKQINKKGKTQVGPTDRYLILSIIIIFFHNILYISYFLSLIHFISTFFYKKILY